MIRKGGILSFLINSIKSQSDPFYDAQFKPSAARLREIAKACATDLLDPEKHAEQW